MCSRNGQFTKTTDESGKVIIVTGCNAGIGKETVRELARRGATVYMACRDKTRAEEARQEIINDTKNQNVFFLELDLASLDSVRKFVEEFKSQQDKLHVLINNAGIYGGPRQLTKDGFEMQLGVNYMGPFLLTLLLVDHLKKSAPSRIVNVSSKLHSFGKIKVNDLNSEKSYSDSGAYNQSKLANIIFTRELAKRLEGSGVTVNALHPGVVNTELMKTSMMMEYLVKPVMSSFLKTTESGAQTSLYAALDPELEKVTGVYFSDCKQKEVSKAATDEETAKFLWAESIKWTGAPNLDYN